VGTTVTYLKRLFAVLLLQKPWYNCRAVGFVADKMLLKQVFCYYL